MTYIGRDGFGDSGLIILHFTLHLYLGFGKVWGD